MYAIRSYYVPFDTNAGKAINAGLSVIDVKCPAQEAVEALFKVSVSYLED